MSNVPLLPISRQVNHLLYASSILSLAILACSLVFLGFTSLWLSEAGVLLTIIHHAIVVHDRRKQNKRREGGPDISLSLPRSARKPMIFLAVLISAVYTAAFAIVLVFVIWLFTGSIETGWEDRWIATLIELACLLFEVPVMLMVALRSMKERRVILGAGTLSCRAGKKRLGYMMDFYEATSSITLRSQVDVRDRGDLPGWIE